MKTKVFVLVATCVAANLFTSSAATLSGPVFNPATTHSYYLLSQNNWTGSELEAVSLGGHLVTINNAAENQWVFDTFANFGLSNRYMWIGLYDLPQTGVYSWVSGEPVTYLNWASGQPSDIGQEHFVYMYPNGAPNDIDRSPRTWNDYLDLAGEFIAPGSPTSPVALFGVVEIVPEPSTITLFGIGAAFVVGRSRKIAH